MTLKKLLDLSMQYAGLVGEKQINYSLAIDILDSVLSEISIDVRYLTDEVTVQTDGNATLVLPSDIVEIISVRDDNDIDISMINKQYKHLLDQSGN